MAEKTITSANSVFTITVPGLFDSPIQLQGYAADKAWSTEGVDLAETVMGVDGIMSAGYVPNVTKQTITLQADSTSNDVFDTLVEATKAQREIFFLNGSIVLPGTDEAFTMTRGTLTNYKPVSDGQKTLQPRDFVITWNDVSKATL